MDWLVTILELIPYSSILFTLTIGSAVAIDVSGLILSQYRDYSENIEEGGVRRKSPKGQAFLHASWHAGLFLIYMLFVSGILNGLIEIAINIPDFRDFFRSIWNFFAELFNWPIVGPIDVTQLQNSIISFFGVAVILLVWTTYSHKIVEDHSKTIKDPDNPLRGQRWDIRFIYWVIRIRMPKTDRALDHALALAVGVDMLAISAIIRVYFKGTRDNGYDGFHVDFWPGETFFGFSDQLLNIGIFAVGVFLSVYFWAKLAANKAAKGESEIQEKNLIRLRKLEPFLVFFVLAGALSHFLIIDFEVNGGIALDSGWLKIGLQLLLAMFIWQCLIWLHGSERIDESVRNGIGFSTKIEGHLDENPSKDIAAAQLSKTSRIAYFKRIGELYFHMPVFFIFYLGIAIIFVVSHAEGISEPYLTLPNWLSVYLAICTVIFLYFPIFMGRFERHLDEIYFPRKGEDTELGRAVLYGSTVLITILVYIHTIFRFGSFISDDISEPFLLGIMLIWILVGGAYMFAFLRAWRNQDTFIFEDEEGKKRVKYSVKSTDVAGAMGVICLTWQLVNFFSSIT